MTTSTRPRHSLRRPEPMTTAEFLDYLALHPATSSLGRRFSRILESPST
jgi:hypothetical protein